MAHIPCDWQSGKTATQCNRHMLEYSVACDVTFLVGEAKEEIPAHKYILVSRSCVFNAMFCGPLAEMSGQPITIKDIEPDIFKIILKYLYYDDALIDQATAILVLYGANKYSIQGLVDVCVRLLANNLRLDNVDFVLDHAFLLDIEELQQKCLEFIAKEARNFLLCPGFCDLSRNSLEAILQSDTIIATEEEIYEAVLRWACKQCHEIEGQEVNYRKVLGQLLYLVRFPLMDQHYFTNNVSGKEILSMEEKVVIFQILLGKEVFDDRFNCKPREAPRIDMFTVERFPADNIDTNNDCGKSCEPPAISFCCSENVLIHGVLVFGKHRFSKCATRCNIGVTLSSASTGLIELHETKQIYTNGEQQRYELMFDTFIKVNKDSYYTIQLKLDDQSLFYFGQGGMSSVTKDGITVQFCSSNTGGCTNVKRGQIAGIVFSR